MSLLGYLKSFLSNTRGDRIQYKGFEFEKVDAVQVGYQTGSGSRYTPGKGRKIKAVYIYSQEDGFERPFKTVDTLAAAKEYIDNY